MGIDLGNMFCFFRVLKQIQVLIKKDLTVKTWIENGFYLNVWEVE